MWPGSARLLLLALSALAGGSGCSELLCRNTAKAVVPSPDGTLAAVAFIRDCGATTADSLQVSVLPSGRDLPNEPGNLYIQRYDQPVELVWEDRATLRLTHEAHVRPVRREPGAGAVKVRYVPAGEGRQ